MKRRNLSGIFIHDTLKGEDRSSPTCIEECNEETLDKWLETLEREGLIRTIKILNETINKLGIYFGVAKD